MRDHRRAPDIPKMLSALYQHRVQFIIVGSVAVEAWGVDAGIPGDLDIVPAPDAENLQRMVSALEALDAEPWAVTGQWVSEDDEHRWEAFPETDPRRGQRRSPDPADVSSFDSLFSTRFGELDIVPRISGDYSWLRERAVRRPLHGAEDVLVAHIDDLLAFLTVPRRKKDADRVKALRAVQRRADA